MTSGGGGRGGGLVSLTPEGCTTDSSVRFVRPLGRGRATAALDGGMWPCATSTRPGRWIAVTTSTPRPDCLMGAHLRVDAERAYLPFIWLR